jgi:hypothetical protein
MQDNANSELLAPKGDRTKLQIEQRTRDLALFNLAIDRTIADNGEV